MQPHFENFFSEGNQYIADVLEYHLNLELLLTMLIEETEAIKRPEALNLERMSFFHKISLCEALGLLEKNMANVIRKLNALRNKYAHRLGFSPTYEEVYELVEEAGAAGVEFTDSVDVYDVESAKNELGYRLTDLLNALYRNTFFEIADSQGSEFSSSLLG